MPNDGTEEMEVDLHINEDVASAIAQIASRTAIEMFEKKIEEYRKTRKQKVHNNTKLLLVNYRNFKEMSENAVYDGDTTNDDVLEEIIGMMNSFWKNDDFKVASIQARVARTQLMLEHIDAMLNVFKEQAEKSSSEEAKRCWRVTYEMYISRDYLTIEEIATKEEVDVRTIYRDLEKAYNKLGVLLFGVDSIIE